MKRTCRDYPLYDVEKSYYYTFHNDKAKIEPIIRNDAFKTNLLLVAGFNSAYILSLYTLFKTKLKILSLISLFFLTAPTFIVNKLAEKTISLHISNYKHARKKKPY